MTRRFIQLKRKKKKGKMSLYGDDLWGASSEEEKPKRETRESQKPVSQPVRYIETPKKKDYKKKYKKSKEEIRRLRNKKRRYKEGFKKSAKAVKRLLTLDEKLKEDIDLIHTHYAYKQSRWEQKKEQERKEQERREKISQVNW